jgi:monoamine oxidase
VSARESEHSLNGDATETAALEILGDLDHGQSGTTGIFVEYPGANVSSSMAQSNPYTTTATNPQVTTLAQDLLTQMEPIFPGITKQWNGKAMLSTPLTEPNFLCSYSYWKPG